MAKNIHASRGHFAQWLETLRSMTTFGKVVPTVWIDERETADDLTHSISVQRLQLQPVQTDDAMTELQAEDSDRRCLSCDRRCVIK